MCIYIHFDVSFLGLKNRGIKDSKYKLCEPELVHVVNLGGHSEAPVHLWDICFWINLILLFERYLCTLHLIPRADTGLFLEVADQPLSVVHQLGLSSETIICFFGFQLWQPTSMIPNRRVLSMAAECHVVPAVSFSPWVREELLHIDCRLDKLNLPPRAKPHLLHLWRQGGRQCWPPLPPLPPQSPAKIFVWNHQSCKLHK